MTHWKKTEDDKRVKAKWLNLFQKVLVVEVNFHFLAILKRKATILNNFKIQISFSKILLRITNNFRVDLSIGNRKIREILSVSFGMIVIWILPSLSLLRMRVVLLINSNIKYDTLT